MRSTSSRRSLAVLAHCSIRSLAEVNSGDIATHLSSFSRAARSADWSTSALCSRGISIKEKFKTPSNAQILVLGHFVGLAENSHKYFLPCREKRSGKALFIWRRLSIHQVKSRLDLEWIRRE